MSTAREFLERVAEVEGRAAMSNIPLPTPSLSKRKGEPAGTKPAIVGVDASGEFIWARHLTPDQDAAWIQRQHTQRDAFLSLAKRESKLAVQYRKWAEEETKPERAAHYAAEALRLRRNSITSLRAARVRNV